MSHGYVFKVSNMLISRERCNGFKLTLGGPLAGNLLHVAHGSCLAKRRSCGFRDLKLGWKDRGGSLAQSRREKLHGSSQEPVRHTFGRNNRWEWTDGQWTALSVKPKPEEAVVVRRAGLARWWVVMPNGVGYGEIYRNYYAAVGWV